MQNKVEIEETGGACLGLVFTVGKRNMDSGNSSAVTFLFALYVSHKISVDPAYIIFKLQFSCTVNSTKLIIHYGYLQLRT